MGNQVNEDIDLFMHTLKNTPSEIGKPNCSWMILDKGCKAGTSQYSKEKPSKIPGL